MKKDHFLARDSPEKFHLEQVEEEEHEVVEDVSAMNMIQRDFPNSHSPIFEDKKTFSQEEENVEQFSFCGQEGFDGERPDLYSHKGMSMGGKEPKMNRGGHMPN